MRKTVIYIDGQNLPYNLQALTLQEKDIHGAAVLADNHHTLIRANWYQAAKISSWAWASYHERRCPPGMTPEAFGRAQRAEYLWQARGGLRFD